MQPYSIFNIADTGRQKPGTATNLYLQTGDINLQTKDTYPQTGDAYL